MSDDNTNLFGQIEPDKPNKKKKYKKESREIILQRIMSTPDVLEDDIELLGQGEDYDSLLEVLLRDQTKNLKDDSTENTKNKDSKSFNHIVWATNNYQARGTGYFETDEIITGNITRQKKTCHTSTCRQKQSWAATSYQTESRSLYPLMGMQQTE